MANKPVTTPTAAAIDTSTRNAERLSSMAAIAAGRNLGKALMDQGVVPKNCMNVELHVPADGLLFLRYEVAVTAEDMSKIAAALVEAGTPRG